MAAKLYTSRLHVSGSSINLINILFHKQLWPEVLRLQAVHAIHGNMIFLKLLEKVFSNSTKRFTRMNWLHFVGLSSGSPHICPAFVKVIYQTPTGNFIIKTFTWTQGWTDDDENESCFHTLRGFFEIWHSDSFVLKKEPYKTDLWPWFKKLCANYTI